MPETLDFTRVLTPMPVFLIMYRNIQMKFIIYCVFGGNANKSTTYTTVKNIN